MPTASSPHLTASSFFAPPQIHTDSYIDGPPAPAHAQPWPLKTHVDHTGDMLSASQSWPPPSDYAHRQSFACAGDELRYDAAVEEPDSPDSPSDTSWSPAAAFLSSFTPAPAHAQREAQSVAGYVLGDTIGYGGFSTIREATSASGGVVAVKIVRHAAFESLPPAERARQRSRLAHETRVWVSLSHENILPLFDAHRTPAATYLITLLCPAGSLLDILRREGTPALEQTDAGCMFRQVVKALQYLHESMRLVHGDIKLENVLVDECGVCRLADFGLTRPIGGDSSQVSSAEEECDAEPPRRARRSGTAALPVHLSLLRHGPHRHRHSSALPATAAPPPTHPDHMFQPGSLPYAAPELLLPHSNTNTNAHGSRPTAHPAQDMWALGVLLYALLTGTLPFRDAFEPRLQMKILRGTYAPPPALVGPLAHAVLAGCLARDVAERWTIARVDDAAWGVGYGNVQLDPGICEEQRVQARTRSRTPPSPELAASQAASATVSRGRRPPPRIAVRSQSRSASPSVPPRTPDDDDDEDGSGAEGGAYFGRGGRRRRRQLPYGRDAEWGYRARGEYDGDGDGEYDDDAGGDAGVEGVRVRGRRRVDAGAVGVGVAVARKEARRASRSQSVPRRWPMHDSELSP